MEGRGAVVADAGVAREVTEDEHRVDQFGALVEDGPDVGRRPPAAQQGRAHGGGPGLGRTQVGDGSGHHLPARSAVSPRRWPGGPPEEREQIAAVGLVAHGPERVDVGAEDARVVGVLERRDRIEGEVAGPRACARDPTGGDDVA